MTPTLALADASRVQDYILSPRTLKLIRGASRLLDELFTNNLTTAVTQHGGKTIFAGGGNLLAHFPSTPDAREFCEQAHREFFEHTGGGAQVVTACAEYDPAHFNVSYHRVRHELALAKLAPRLPSLALQSGHYLRSCAACGQFAATQEIIEDPGALCAPCFKRREYSNRSLLQANPPKDFQEIGESGRPVNYLALIAIDFDRMGEWFDNYATSSTSQCSFVSHCLDDLVDQSVREAVRLASVPKYEILIIGGDDLSLVVPAGCFIPFLHEFQNSFDQRFLDFQKTYCERYSPKEPPGKITFSAGISIAHSHFPIAEFFTIAKNLQKSAKQLKNINSLDYELISTSLYEDPRDLRERLAVKGALRTAKPYALDDFLNLTRKISAAKPEIPSNKARSLYRIAYQSPMQADLDYLYVLARLNPRARARMRDLVGAQFWNPSPKYTRAADIAELWELV